MERKKFTHYKEFIQFGNESLIIINSILNNYGLYEVLCTFGTSSGNIPKVTNFNILGQEVRTLVGETQQAGIYTVQWDGRNDTGEQVSGGLYLYRLKVNDFVETKKMLLVK